MIPDPHTLRLIHSVARTMNLLECFDDTGIEPIGAAKKEAEGILKTIGPAAVTCALLQAAPALQESPRSGAIIDLFDKSSQRRREELLSALPVPQRRAIEQRETERSVAPERVIELFEEALEGLSGNEVLQRWGSGGGLSALSGQIEAIADGREPDPDALAHLLPSAMPQDSSIGPGPGQVPEETQLPPALLDGLSAVLSGIEVDDGVLERVLSGALPVSAPEGYRADAMGTVVRDKAKVGRNSPCTCGSGKKFKKCCGR